MKVFTGMMKMFYNGITVNVAQFRKFAKRSLNCTFKMGEFYSM